MARIPLRRPDICFRCLKRLRRAYSSTPTGPASPPTSGYARLSNRRLISVHGADAPKFLQGLTTNNLHPSWTSGWYSAFLTAQGRVLWDVFIYPTTWSRAYKSWLDSGTGKGKEEGNWSCLIEVDADEVEHLAKHLKRHKLRSKIHLKVVDEGEWNVFATWGGNASETSGPQMQHVPDPTAPIRLVDPRVPAFGQRVLLPSQDALPNAEGMDQLESANLESYTLRRYFHGIAEGQKEILKDHALPQESNIDFMNGVDFRKGCYIGQELTIRTHHTGVVRKRILPVQLYPSEAMVPSTLDYERSWDNSPAPQGADIKKAEGRGRSAGKFLAGIANVGLALCRLEMMTDLRLTAEGGMYKDGDQFKLQWEGGNDVRIKAFVPDWIRSQLQIREPPRRVE